VLDTTLTGDHVGVAAYISRGLSLGDKPLATEFVAVPCEVQYGEVEKVGGE
jgi:translation initiation factor 3 subunit F